MTRCSLVALALFLMVLTHGFSESIEEPVEVNPPPASFAENGPFLEGKIGYFFFTDSKMRQVYSKGGLDLQLTGGCPLQGPVQIYASVEYWQRHGRSLSDDQRTSIWGLPLSIGLRPVFKISPNIQYYFTLGPRYVFVFAHNNSSFVDSRLKQNGIGGFVNTGFNFFTSQHFFLDLFVEYSYVKLRFHPSMTNVFADRVQVGGVTAGVGLGYLF